MYKKYFQRFIEDPETGVHGVQIGVFVAEGKEPKLITMLFGFPNENIADAAAFGFIEALIMLESSKK